MAWQIIPSLFLFFFLSLSPINSVASQENPVILGLKCVDTNGNYTENSPFHSNLLNAFSNLTSLSYFNAFSKFTVGTDEDATSKVYALYDCRNDHTLRICHNCIEDATEYLLQHCPSKEAIVTYEECMLRYANRPIFSQVELTPYYHECEISIPDGGELNRTVEPMVQGLIDEATSKNSSRYFATGERTYFEYQKVYSLVQCTPNLSREQCKECLVDALNYTLQCAGASLMISYHHGPSCEMRYDVVRHFFNLSSSSLSISPMASPPILSPQLKTGDGGQRLISIESLVFLLFLFCLL